MNTDIKQSELMKTLWLNQILEYDIESIVLASYLGVDTYEAHSYINDQDYLVLTDEEADEAVREYIEETVWAFNPSFLSAYTRVSEEAIKKIQELHEDANDALAEMIKDFDEFVEDAVACDGRGHFLAGYDGNENEVTFTSLDDTKTIYYIYRRN
jgi:hypothetical protein